MMKTDTNKMSGRPVAAITGASSGFGKIFAERLAKKGYDLILIARRENLLAEIAKSVSERYSVQVDIVPADLSIPDDLARVENLLEKTDRLAWLVNSAGFGGNSSFPFVNIKIETDMVLVHCLATMRLCRAALIPMVANRFGRIVNLASAAGFMAGYGAADYTATKAYLITFSKSLQCDVGCHGVRVQALCPGFVHTEFHDTATMAYSGIKQKVPGFLWINADRVVRTSLRAIERSLFYRVICIPSLRYKIITWFASDWIFGPLRVLFSRGSIR